MNLFDESPTEISESQESLEVFDILWIWPVQNGFIFHLVHLDAILADDVPEELCREVMQFIFFN